MYQVAFFMLSKIYDIEIIYITNASLLGRLSLNGELVKKLSWNGEGWMG